MTLVLHGLGTRTPVRLAGRVEELGPAVRAAWSRCLDPDAPGAGDLETDPISVCLGDGDAASGQGDPDGGSDSASARLAGEDLGPLLQRLTQEVTYAKIRAQAGRLFMLHAAAVAHPVTGDAVAFVAPGGTGKTTLVRRLGERYAYLTDETVGFDAGGLVRPYLKPLSLRPGAGEYSKAETSPDALGLVALHTGPDASPTPASTLTSPDAAPAARPSPRCRLRRIVVLRRDDAHGPPEVESLSLFDAIAALAPETSSLAAMPRPLHALADLLRTLDETVLLSYREAADVVGLVDDWLEAT